MTAPIRTYSLFGARTTPPSEYELVTSHLHPYARRGFEVDVPLAEWYARNQRGSAFQSARWDAFCDPRETTYTSYTRLQARQERELDAQLDALAAPDAYASATTAQLSALRFPIHALHMTAAYIGQMAPASRVTIAALFQAADELRRIERFAMLVRARSSDLESADACGRSLWLHAAAWQPLRAMIEQLLVAYDWGEALVALELCIKPVFDELVHVEWPRRAPVAGDPRLLAVLAGLYPDCLWHRVWSAELVRTALDGEPGTSRTAVGEWVELWTGLAARAIDALAPALGARGGP